MLYSRSKTMNVKTIKQHNNNVLKAIEIINQSTGYSIDLNQVDNRKK